MSLLLLLTFAIDLSAFDPPQAVCAVAVDLSAFDDAPVSLDSFDARPHVDLSAFDEPKKPAVKARPAALDYPLRKTNWTHPGNTKSGIVDHLLNHPNHAGKFSAEMLMGLDYNELDSLPSDDHEGAVQVAAIKNPSPAAVSCVNGLCTARVSSSPRAVAEQGLSPAMQAPQPVIYYTGNWCPTGNCPTPQPAGLFTGLRMKGR